MFRSSQADGTLDPLIVFDECHKAKNLLTGNGQPTKTALAVVAIQEALPKARVLYCSATGASEPKNLAYMVRKLHRYGMRECGAGASSIHHLSSIHGSHTHGYGNL